jgi:hypothetical protein
MIRPKRAVDISYPQPLWIVGVSGLRAYAVRFCYTAIFEESGITFSDSACG